MKVRFYGKLGEMLGAEVDIDPPSGTDTIMQLRNLLADLYPDAAQDILLRSRACVADSVVSESHKLGGDEAVEFFPPLSGG